MRPTFVLTGAMLLLLAACGGDDDTPSATPEIVIEGATSPDPAPGSTAAGTEAAPAASSATDEERALAFVDCMRDNGVDMEDPTVNADGSVNIVPPGGGGPGAGGGGVDDDVQAAFGLCADELDGASFLPTERDLTEIEDQLLDVAQCLRDQGIDVDDPDLSGGFGGGGGGPFGEAFDPDDPETAAAIDACSGLFTGFGPGQGQGQGS